MTATRPTAAHASVVFLKIAGYSQSPVGEQLRLKDRLEGLVAAALAAVAESSRIVLEARDGAAVVVLGDPAAALELAQRACVGSTVPVSAGIAHGPVRVSGGEASPLVLGDGIAVADAVAGFTPQGGVAATREFRDALAAAAPGLARFLAPAGMRTDERDRSYEVFLADRDCTSKRRRRWIVTTAAACATIVALGLLARGLKDPRVDERATAGVPAPGKAPARPARATEPAPKALATIRLEIRPRGEVFIDGASKGTTPPLASIQVAPGRHTIEIRHGRASPLVLQVEAGPGEELVVRHAFPQPPAPQKPVWRKWYEQARDQLK